MGQLMIIPLVIPPLYDSRHRYSCPPLCLERVQNLELYLSKYDDLSPANLRGPVNNLATVPWGKFSHAPGLGRGNRLGELADPLQCTGHFALTGRSSQGNTQECTGAGCTAELHLEFQKEEAPNRESLSCRWGHE